MKKVLLSFLFCFLAVSAANGQATGNNKLVWDQVASDLATANGYTYKYYPDAIATGTNLTPVTCTGTTSPFVCTVPFPAFTPGAHTLTITAANAAGESPKSGSFAFTFVVIPASPSNIRIQ